MCRLVLRRLGARENPHVRPPRCHLGCCGAGVSQCSNSGSRPETTRTEAVAQPPRDLARPSVADRLPSTDVEPARPLRSFRSGMTSAALAQLVGRDRHCSTASIALVRARARARSRRVTPCSTCVSRAASSACRWLVDQEEVRGRPLGDVAVLVDQHDLVVAGRARPGPSPPSATRSWPTPSPAAA